MKHFLRSQRVAQLGTVDENGRPHVVPIVFVYADGRLYTPIDKKPKSVAPEGLRRVQNILHNQHVQILIHNYDEDWSRLGYVQLRGPAELLKRGYEHRRALRLLERKYPQYSDLPLEGCPIIKVSIERTLTWGRLERPASDAAVGPSRVTVDGVKRVSAGDRIAFRAKVIRSWVVGDTLSALVGDATGLTRIEMGRRRIEEEASYSFWNGLVREYEGGWRSVALDSASRVRLLRRPVLVTAPANYIERVASILMKMDRKRSQPPSPNRTVPQAKPRVRR